MGETGRLRRIVQSGLTLFFLLAPWISFGDFRLLGFGSDGVLRVFGTVLSPSGLFPYLLLLLALLFLTLFAAASLGRLWCGWLCPQSVFADLASRLGSKGGIAFASLFLAVSSAIYYMPPVDFFLTLAALDLRYPHYYALAAWILLYLDMAYVGRRFCRSICPYGKVLSLLADREAVGVGFSRDRAALCKGCDKCARVCPMDLQVRIESSPECIACGRCVDACAEIFAKSPEAPLIEFVVPKSGILKGVLLRPRNAALLGAAIVAGALFVYTLGLNSGVDLIVRPNPRTPPKVLADGRIALFLSAHLTGKAGVYSLSAVDASGKEGDLRGEVSGLELSGEDAREAKFALLLFEGTAGIEDFVLKDAEGSEVARVRLDVARSLKGVR